MKKFEFMLGLILAFLVVNLGVNIAVLQRLKRLSYKGIGTAVSVDERKSVVSSTALPQLIKRVEPEYPEEAKRKGWQGKVFLRALVDTNGKVTDVEIMRSSGYPCLDSAAIEAAKKFEFKPAVEDGVKKATYIVIPFKFGLKK